MALNDNSEMRRMQQDAIHRVQEMQSRARQFNSQSRETRREPEHHAPEPPPVPKPQPPAPAPQNSSIGIGGIFDNLMKDSERTLILVLILLLVSEKADTELIFALMFLII